MNLCHCRCRRRRRRRSINQVFCFLGRFRFPPPSPVVFAVNYRWTRHTRKKPTRRKDTKTNKYLRTNCTQTTRKTKEPRKRKEKRKSKKRSFICQTLEINGSRGRSVGRCHSEKWISLSYSPTLCGLSFACSFVWREEILLLQLIRSFFCLFGDKESCSKRLDFLFGSNKTIYEGRQRKRARLCSQPEMRWQKVESKKTKWTFAAHFLQEKGFICCCSCRNPLIEELVIDSEKKKQTDRLGRLSNR